MLNSLRAHWVRFSSHKLSLVFLVLILVAVPLAVWMALTSQENRQRASDTPVTPPNANGTVQLELSTSELTSNPENLLISAGPLNIAVILHAGDYNITGLDFTLNFNDTTLPVTQFTPSNKFDSVLTNVINHNNGTFHFVGVTTNTSVINSGNVSVGTITVNPKTLGTGPLTFTTSQVTALGFENPIPATYVNKNYLVVANPTPAPTIALSTVNYAIPDQGWNLIGVPVIPTTPTYASDLKTLSGCVEVVRWNPSTQAWESSTTINFSLEGGRGYFVRCEANNRKTFSITGSRYESTPNLVHGWNLTAIPYSSGLVAVSAFVNSLPTKSNIKEVDIYEFGGWTSHLVGLPVNNFTVQNNKGYFIKYADPTSTVAIASLTLPDYVAPTNTPIPLTATPLPSATPTAVPPTLTPIPGNIDDDPAIDIRDFNVWRDEFLGTVFTKRSDLNKDTKIDLIDFNIWRTEFQKQFDATPTSAASFLTPTVTRVELSGNTMTVYGNNFLPDGSHMQGAVLFDDGNPVLFGIFTSYGTSGTSWGATNIHFPVNSFAGNKYVSVSITLNGQTITSNRVQMVRL